MSLGFLWLAASAGTLSTLTPCVFPMVPITVSYFVKHSGSSRAHAVRHALLFGLGIIVSFTGTSLRNLGFDYAFMMSGKCSFGPLCFD